MTETPLIYTTKGNIPIDSLRFETIWDITEDYIKFVERYYLDTEIVKESAHVYDLKGLNSQLLIEGI